jgi:hypothetical protein
MFAGLAVSKYGPRFGFDMEDEFRTKVRTALNDEVLPRHLAHLERKLTASTTGWLAAGPHTSTALARFSAQLPAITAVDLSQKPLVVVSPVTGSCSVGSERVLVPETTPSKLLKLSWKGNEWPGPCRRAPRSPPSPTLCSCPACSGWRAASTTASIPPSWTGTPR